jgi:general secretion pathway protein C
MLLQDRLNFIHTHMSRYYHIIFNVIAITIVVYIGVDIFHRIIRMKFVQVDIKPAQKIAEPAQIQIAQTTLKEYQPVIDRNIFSKVNVEAAKSGQAEAVKFSSLKLVLMGTIAGDNKTSAAFIEDSGTRTQGLYKVGDNIQGAVIKSITRNKVILKAGSRDEILTMGEGAPTSSGTIASSSPARGQTASSSATQPVPVTAAAERNISMNRTEINESLKDLNGLLSQASIQPHSTDGQADGLAVTGIKAGSIFRKMGLRNGDVVKSVNNEAIKSPEDLINMYNELKSSPDISIQIQRRGEERTLNYNFVD